jgi:hypothetical protein
MTNRLLGPDGRPMSAPEITALYTRDNLASAGGNHNHDSQPKDQRDLTHCQYLIGPAGPFGFGFCELTRVWLVFHDGTRKVVGWAQFREDAVSMIDEWHVMAQTKAENRAWLLEEGRENYRRQQGLHQHD